MRGSRLRIRRLTATAVIVTATLLAAPASAQTENIVVDAASQVTTNPTPARAHSSPQIARNPKTGELVTIETDVYGGFGVNVHISRDDGRSWARGGDPMMKPFTWNSDLAINGPYFGLTFDTMGTLFLTFSATDPRFADRNRSDRPRPVFLARSTDSGRIFTTTVVYQPQEANPKTLNNRRAMLALDPKDSSKIYVSWLQTLMGEKSRAMIAASADGGKTFKPPIDLAEAEPQGAFQPRPAVTPDGVVHAVYPGGGFTPPAPAGQPAPDPLVRPVFYQRSADGGATWTAPVQIDQGGAGFFQNRKHLLVADPTSGALYLTWYGHPQTRPAADEDADIYLRVSRDGGKTWSDRVTVNDDASRPKIMHYDPGISIAPNGRVDIAWYDFRNSPIPEQVPPTFAAPFNFGGFQDVYFASSTDGGRTFSDNVRITDRIIDRNIGVWSNNVHSHYNVGITSTNSAVYFAWQDTRNGNSVTNSEDIYFTSLRFGSRDIADSGSGDVPFWVVAGASGAIGMGIAMLVVIAVGRRRSTAAVPARV